MKLHLLLFASLLPSAIAEARLGESFEECVARYGEPVQVIKSTKSGIFRKAGITIRIFFNSDGIADALHFKREEGPRLEKTEARVIAKSNLGESALEDDKRSSLVWSDESGRVGHFSVLDATLIVFTPEGGRRIVERGEQHAAEKLQGF